MNRTALFLCLMLLPVPFFGQQPDTTRPAAGSFLNCSLPSDMFTEWWLTLRNGAVISADKSTIELLNSGDLHIRGSLRELRVPTREIAGISEVPLRNQFTTAMAGTFFLASMLSFSPSGTPGYYIGTLTNYTGEAEFPSLSAASLLISAGCAAAVGFLAQSAQPRTQYIALDGSESRSAWDLLLDGDFPRWHLRGCAAFPGSSMEKDWRTHHERFGIVDGVTQQTYYYGQSTLDMTSFNMGRMLRIGYSLSRDLEAGVAYQSDGVQRFSESFAYTRPGNPPQPIVQTLTNQARTDLMLLACQYTVFRAGRRLALQVGAAAGIASATVEVNGFDLRAGKQQILKTENAALLGFATLEYFLDRNLSLGLQADFSHAGTITIPRQTIQDYDGRISVILDPLDLAVSSYSIGLAIGIHL